MSWSVIGSGFNSGGPTAATITKPAGTASGDLILIFASTESSTGAATSTGFTAIGDKASTLQSIRVTALSKVAGGSEPSSYTVSGASGTNYLALAIIVVRSSTGLAATPIDASSSNANTTNGTAVSISGVTTTAIDELIVHAVNWNGNESFTIPTGFSGEGSDNPNGNYLFAEAQSSSGATGTISSTLSASDAWIAWLVAVAPSGGGGGSTVNGSATEQSNSALTESSAILLAPATEQANSQLAESAARILASASEQSNSQLSEAAQLLAQAIEQSNSALALPTVQVIAPAIAMQANSVLVANGGSVGQTNEIANSALVVSGRIVAPATVQANSALVASAQIATGATLLQANAALSEPTAQVSANATLQANSAMSEQQALLLAPVSLAANAAIAEAARILASGIAEQSNSLLAATGTTNAPSGIGSVTLADAPLGTVALADALLASGSVALSDSALGSVALSDLVAELVGV